MITELLNAIDQVIPLPLLGVGLAFGLSLIAAIRARQVTRPRVGGITPGDYRAQARLRFLGTLLFLAGVIQVYFLIQSDIRESAARPTPYPEGYVGEVDPMANLSLSIPVLAVRTSVIEAPIVADQWDISRLTGEVAHLQGTAYPGGSGNAVLAGHVTIPQAGWGPFQELENIPIGEHIFVEYGDQVLRTYEVAEVFTVEPSEVSVVYPQGDDRLTLITCTGWDDALETYALRVIVVAFPVTPDELPG